MFLTCSPGKVRTIKRKLIVDSIRLDENVPIKSISILTACQKQEAKIILYTVQCTQQRPDPGRETENYTEQENIAMYPIDRNPYKYKDAQDVLNEGKDNTTLYVSSYGAM